MEPFHEEAVMRAVTAAHRKPIDFSVRLAETEGLVYIDFQTPHPGFFWSNPNDPHALTPPLLIVDGYTGEVRGGTYIFSVIAFQNPDSLPWQGAGDDGTSVQSEAYTLACNENLLYTEEGADELRRFLQASLGEGSWIALSGFQFRS